MKIEIEITSKRHATITIDGRKMEVNRSLTGTGTKLEGITGDEIEETLGGMTAHATFEMVDKIFDAMAITRNEFKTWDRLPPEVANDACF
jgi:hypothetical protein